MPDASYLRARVDRLYLAEQANDWGAWLQLASPELKTAEGKNEFLQQVQDERDFKIVEFRIKNIRSVSTPEGSGATETTAAVSMDVLVEERTGHQHKEDYQTDYWVRLKGEWYWYWRGWPDD